jgi:SMI1 / KNR4 family (SUKH-1)
MSTIEQLAELFAFGATPWAALYKATPPTTASVSRINHDLGIELPTSFVAFAALCPRYGTWFASIGDDYDSYLHILRLNIGFHADDIEDEPNHLPPWLILFNHGHDGDCDCFDTRSRTSSGEHPLLYYSIPDSDQLQPPSIPQPLAASFQDYLDELSNRMANSYRSYLGRQDENA